jgi:hypothetical protein
MGSASSELPEVQPVLAKQLVVNNGEVAECLMVPVLKTVGHRNGKTIKYPLGGHRSPT